MKIPGNIDLIILEAIENNLKGNGYKSFLNLLKPIGILYKSGQYGNPTDCNRYAYEVMRASNSYT